MLPLFAAHFCGRYRNEEFLIYDRTHKEALIWQNGEARFEPDGQVFRSSVYVRI